MRRAQTGVLAALTLTLAASAVAQTTGSFDETETRSFLAPDQLNREACEDPDDTVTLTLRGTAPTGATFVGYVFDDLGGTGRRPPCFSYTVAQEEAGSGAVFRHALQSPPSNLNEEIAIEVGDLVGDACTVEGGLRDGDRALCVYMVRPGEVAVDSIGFFVAVDTAVPEKPTIDSLRPGNGRALFTVGNVDDDDGDVYEYLVQHRRCGEGGADTGGDANDAGAAPPDAGAASDAGLQADAGADLDDAGADLDDAGLDLDDAGLDLDDAGAGEGEGEGEGEGDEEPAQVKADSTCGATEDFTQSEERSPNVTLSDLENGVRYELRVAVRDDFGNVSPFSDARTVTPEAGNGPLDFYNGSGSPWSTAPSCASTTGGASLLGFVALLGLVALPRRRRRQARARGAWLSLALVPALFAALPSAAQEDIVPESRTTALRNGEVTFSLFAGPYRPAIDSERVGGERVFPIYNCFFDDALLAELGASVDYHLLDVFGSLQLGIGLNATQAQGFTLAASSGGEVDCSRRTTDSIELTIIKVKPQITYRLDPLLDWFGFPLVPYGRLGVVGAVYAFTENGVFPDPATKAQNPLGLVLGWEAAGGLMFALDFWDYLDPFSKWGTMRGRANGVFNHAYIYAEALWSPIDNFGRPSLKLSPTDPFTGSEAPWTVHFGVAVELL